MKTVTLNALLEVMDMKKFHELKNRGRLFITRPAPYMEVLLSSIPIRYRHKLTGVR